MGVVVKLPTAAKRKVDNLRFAAQRQAMLAARHAEPWPGEKLSSRERDTQQLAVEMREIEQTPALIAVSAIFRVLDDETYRKVLEQLAPSAVSGNLPCQQALTTAKVSRLTVGEQFDLLAAMNRLEGR